MSVNYVRCKTIRLKYGHTSFRASLFQYPVLLVKEAYREFERKLQSIAVEKGEKSSLILNAVQNMNEPFKSRRSKRKCPARALNLYERS